MRKNTILAAVVAAILTVTMSVTAVAAQNPFAQMEAQSRQAVDTAIKAGTVPPGTTIYDCMYGSDKNGVTIVIQYKDKNGEWIDVTTQKKVDNKPAGTTGAANKPDQKLSDDTLAEYAAEVFRLVNEEREKVGLDEVVWDDDFAACAQIRAEELAVKYSHERPEPVNDGINWPRNTSGKGIYNAPSVADEQGVPHTWIMENIAAVRGSPADVVKAWMESSGHRNNILRENHVRCGVGVYKTSETIYWSLWFDDYTEN